MSEAREKRVALNVNLEKPQARERGEDLLDWLRNRCRVTGHNLAQPLSPKTLAEADFVIVLGGDGTILSTVREMADHQVPVIGVNIGKLGFLAEFSLGQLHENFERVLTDAALVSRRIMLDCEVAGPGRAEPVALRAVNELAVTAGPPFRMIEVSIRIGEEHLAVCLGDGLVVATPTGSTAYNLSAGGPILAAGLEAAVLTPLAAHSLSFRPIVVDLSRSIRLQSPELHGHRHGLGEQCWGAAVAAVDGQQTVALSGEDTVTITRARTCWQLVHHPQQSQWRVLNRKLNWGVLPNYGDQKSRTT